MEPFKFTITAGQWVNNSVEVSFGVRSVLCTGKEKIPNATQFDVDVYPGMREEDLSILLGNKLQLHSESTQVYGIVDLIFLFLSGYKLGEKSLQTI